MTQKTQSTAPSQNQFNLHKHKNSKQQQQKQQKVGTIGVQEIPHFVRQDFIFSGYRLRTQKKFELLKSTLYMHNETINIWTHFIGAILLSYIIVKLIMHEASYFEFELFNTFKKSSIEILQKWFGLLHDLETLIQHEIELIYEFKIQEVSFYPIYILLISALMCMSLSSLYHTFHPLNQTVGKYLLRADFSGIHLLIIGSSWPIYYYGFFCEMQYFYFYISIIVAVNVFVFFICLQDFIHTEQYYTAKVLMQGACGLFSTVPALHLTFYEIYQSQSQYSSAPCIVFYALTMLCYGLGLLIYGTKWPERNSPKKFDVCGSSHQIFHLLVMVAIFFTLVANLNAHEQRQKYHSCNTTL